DHYCDEATFVDWEQDSPDLPDWQTSWRHITADGQVAELTQPSVANQTRDFPRPVEAPAAGARPRERPGGVAGVWRGAFGPPGWRRPPARGARGPGRPGGNCSSARKPAGGRVKTVPHGYRGARAMAGASSRGRAAGGAVERPLRRDGHLLPGHRGAAGAGNLPRQLRPGRDDPWPAGRPGAPGDRAAARCQAPGARP